MGSDNHQINPERAAEFTKRFTEAGERQRQEVNKILGDTRQSADYWRERYELAQTELAELRKDNERLDWLEAHEADLDVGEGRWFVFVGERPTQTYEGSTPRDAIDAAMEGEQ